MPTDTPMSDPTLAPLLTMTATHTHDAERQIARADGDRDMQRCIENLICELDAQRQRVSSLTAENARLREERDELAARIAGGASVR